MKRGSAETLAGEGWMQADEVGRRRGSLDDLWAVLNG